MVQPGQVGAGLVERVGFGVDVFVGLGSQGVVPVAVPVVAAYGECVVLPVTDLDLGRVGVGVQFGVDAQSGAGGGGGDALHDDLVAGQWPAAPVHGDVGEQPVLDFVPFRGAGREVADGDLQAGFQGQGGEFGLPGAGTVTVGAAGVGGDEQPSGVRIVDDADRVPPASDRLRRERGGVVVGADVHPTGVGGEVVD